MRRMYYFTCLLFLASITPAFSASRYCYADITMGEASFDQGDADINNFPVRQNDGSYQSCDIFMGEVSFCQGSTDVQQFPVRQSDGYFYDCDIFMGRVSFCQGLSEKQHFPVRCR